MARARRRKNGRFMKSNSPTRRRRRIARRASTNAAPRRRRRARRNFYSAGVLTNAPRRRRRARHNPARRARRHYRRNPSFLGFEMPQWDAVVFTGAGLVVPSIAASQIIKFIPASFATNPIVLWLVKVISVIAPSMLVRKFVSTRAGNFMLVGGAANVVLDAVKTYLPGVIPGLGSQPLLGQYSGMGSYFDRGAPVALPFNTQRAANGMPRIIATTPDRLDPAGRF